MLKQFSSRIIVFYAISMAFIFLSLWFTVKKDFPLVNTLPIVLAIVLLAIYSADKVLMLIVLLTPLSLPLRELVPSLSFDMFLPTEPLLFGILLLFLIKLPSNQGIRKEIWLHPVSITIWIYLAWLFVTTLTSTMPMVSLKFTLVKIWFIVGFYLMGIMLFENRANYRRFVWLYIISFLIVIGYTISRHAGYGLLDKRAAHFVMTPFYNDHTSYGAVMALFMPFLFLFSFSRQNKPVIRWISRIVLLIIIFAFILSYSRAAWLSFFAGAGVWALMKLKIRFRTIIIAVVSFVAFVLIFENQVVMYLEKNSEESSSNLKEHFSSMSNITTDASNLERINRWSCAIRMFRDKPLFGYGPGTYMFQYAPYQLTKDRTIISTNAGDVGGAHSEYLGPLSESGLIGMLTVLAIFGTVIFIAFRTYARLRDPAMRGFLLAAFIGLVTYYFHGFLNNFLDTDKASVPFWGFTAMIVALDYYSRKEAFPEKT